jgi:hypothetical protein
VHLLVELAEAFSLPDQQRPPSAFMARYGATFRRDELAPAEVPALPALAGQLHVAQQPQQLEGHVRYLVFSGKPVL